MDEQSEMLHLGMKKRKGQRACDICRRRKVRCDGSSNSMSKCTNCITGNHNCTYTESKVRRVPRRSPESLGVRLDKMESMVNNALVGGDNGTDTRGKGSPSTQLGTPTPPLPFLTPDTVPDVDEDELSNSEDEAKIVNLVYDMQKFKVDPALRQRFFGKSSSAVFLTTARALKQKYAEIHECGDLSKTFPTQRPEFWTPPPWIRARLQAARKEHDFPEHDLLWLLIDKYFTYVNAFLPLLHRPTFESQVADGLHIRDGGFGGVVSLVCALGSQHTGDPRVLLPGTSDPASAGWVWFDQVQLLRNSCLIPASIYEIQSYSLSGSYLMGSSSPQAGWNTVGIGLRLLQDIGAHRKKVYKSNPTVDDELKKRAFWCLTYQDRIGSAVLGRSPAFHDEDFDVDPPVDCNDEYWAPTDGGIPFKQPPGIPSTTTFFNLSHRLNQIATFALRTIYSINRSKVLLGFVGPQWQQAIVVQLDSALNKWVDSIPNYLRWDPSRENDLFFNQSAILYAQYYQTQILIHRPFIPKPGKPSPLSFPSLAICANAARSCSHIVDLQRKRESHVLYLNAIPATCAGIVLLVNIWGATQAGVGFDVAKEKADVRKCLEALSACETRYLFAGRFLDILRDLAGVGYTSHAGPLESNGERAHGSDEPMDLPFPGDASGAQPNGHGSTADSPPISTATPDIQGVRGDPGSLRAAGSVSTPGETDGHSSPGSLSGIFDSDAFPITTNDLGRLPLHHGIKLPTNFSLGETANGPNTSTSSTPLGCMQPSPGSGQGEHLENHFPWMACTKSTGTGETSTGPTPVFSATVNETERTASLLDSTMSSLFGDVPSTSSIALGKATGLSSGSAMDTTDDPMGLLDVLLPSMGSPVGIHPSLTVLNIQQPNGVQEGRGYGGLPTNAEAYFRGWSNAPQAFEWGDWSDYVNGPGDLGRFGVGLSDYRANPNPPS